MREACITMLNDDRMIVIYSRCLFEIGCLVFCTGFTVFMRLRLFKMACLVFWTVLVHEFPRLLRCSLFERDSYK